MAVPAIRAVVPVEQRVGGVGIQPSRIVDLRIGLGQLTHHAIGNAKRGGVDHIPIPQGQIGGTTVGEVGEVFHITLKAQSPAGDILALVCEHGHRAGHRAEQADQEYRQLDKTSHRVSDKAVGQQRTKSQHDGQYAGENPLPAHRARGTQPLVFHAACTGEFAELNIAVLPILAGRLHLVQVEYRAAHALRNDDEQVQQRIFRFAQSQLLRVGCLINGERQNHDGAGDACRILLALVGGNHLAQAHRRGLAHVDAAIHVRRPRIDGNGLLDGERQHGGGQLAVFIGLARRRIDHANQTGCGSRTDAGLVAPVFDAATVLRTPVAGDHSPDTPRAQRDAEHDADNPEHETSSGSESLLVEPALLLLIFVLFQVLEMIAGSLAGDALGFGGIERRDHIEVVAIVDVVGRERVAAVAVALGFRSALGVQPCP